MSFDGIVTRALVKELNENICGGRIDKIYQQEKDEILVHIHNKGENYKLLISVSSNNSRAYLTKISKLNPDNPPMFCMLLRKHIQGGYILNIEQFQLDRVISMDIQSPNEMGELTVKTLIFELMGKWSNIILIEKSTKKIIDSIKRVPEGVSRIRQILPGLTYEYPPSEKKLNPLNLDKKSFLERIGDTNKNSQIYKFFYKNYTGLSPLVSREICYRANINGDNLLSSVSNEEMEKIFLSFSDLIKGVNTNNFTPNIINAKSLGKVFFHALDILQFNHFPKEYDNSMSKILEKFYEKRDMSDRISQKSSSIKKIIETKMERSRNKLLKQKKELVEAQKRDIYKIYADLISANIYKIDRGIKEINLENFYDENSEVISIPLDVKLSPSQNAQKYYKKYAKLKNAAKLLDQQIPQTEEEISYLENVMIGIENCTDTTELDEIKEELFNEGYIKSNPRNKKKKETVVSKPYHFISSDGIDIFVGKNNKQNDYLTLKFANREDLWLHGKNIPGSHVIIRFNENIPETTIIEGATLAAYFSRGKNSQNVSVDYTLKKYVKKPKGSKPGMVIYENYKTIYVNPDKDIIEKMKRAE